MRVNRSYHLTYHSKRKNRKSRLDRKARKARKLAKLHFRDGYPGHYFKPAPAGRRWEFVEAATLACDELKRGNRLPAAPDGVSEPRWNAMVRSVANGATVESDKRGLWSGHYDDREVYDFDQKELNELSKYTANRELAKKLFLGMDVPTVELDNLV
jgi:hypothetical protein